MKVLVTWEFEVDVSDLDPKFVDIPGLAKDLTKQELNLLLTSGELSADDFDYAVSGLSQDERRMI